jgi:hypothetical protein
MKTIHGVVAMLVVAGFAAGEVRAQRAPGSPFSVTVTRAKTESGRQTNYDTGYSSSKNYSRSVALKVTIRNMTTNEVDTKVEGLFVAEAMSAGAADGIYCRQVENEKIPPRGSKDFTLESEPLKGHEYKGYYYNEKSGSKFKGYLVRVFANDQLAEVNGSQPSLQKLGWDEKALKKMLPQEAEEERPPRRFGGGDVPPRRAEEPAPPARAPEPAKKGGATSF